jgi:transposase
MTGFIRCPDRHRRGSVVAGVASLDLNRLTPHVREFVETLTGRHGERLDDWMSDIQNSGAPFLRSFTNGLCNDLGALTAGLTLDHNSGAVEGTGSSAKTIKRGMCGRAKFELLSKRILNPA